MNVDRFWQIIDEIHRDSEGIMDHKCEMLGEKLAALSPRDLKDFIRHFEDADERAYTWSLWGAAFVINGGCSDDSFADFRATLISLGRETFERVLADPEELAAIEMKGDDCFFYEGFQYIKNEVGADRLGALPQRTHPFPQEPSGSRWDENNVSNLYPRLAAKYAAATRNKRHAGGPSRPWWRVW